MKKILIIEDEDTVLKTLREKFEKENFEVILAKDGDEGLKMALEARPDLILLDIIMPRMDGMTMMKRLRETNAWGKNVPIILLTNLNADDRIIRGVTEDEPAYYLVKTNWTLDEVVEKVRNRLGENR